MKNDRTQFEIKSMLGQKEIIWKIYQWCLANLKLKEDKGLVYWVTEMFIITSSQKNIDKINKYLGSNFTFENETDARIFYVTNETKLND